MARTLACSISPIIMGVENTAGSRGSSAWIVHSCRTTRSVVASSPIRGRCSGSAAVALGADFFGVLADARFGARFGTRFEARALRLILRGFMAGAPGALVAWW